MKDNEQVFKEEFGDVADKSADYQRLLKITERQVL